MRMIHRASLVLLVAMVAAFYAPQVALAQGCPWCTTPTTCSKVGESTPIGGCKVIQTCEEIAGSCTLAAALSPENRAATLAANDLEYHGSTVLATSSGALTLIATTDGLLVRWGCDGQPVDIYETGASGELIRLDPAPFRDSLALALDMLASD